MTPDQGIGWIIWDYWLFWSVVVLLVLVLPFFFLRGPLKAGIKKPTAAPSSPGPEEDRPERTVKSAPATNRDAAQAVRDAERTLKELESREAPEVHKQAAETLRQSPSIASTRVRLEKLREEARQAEREEMERQRRDEDLARLNSEGRARFEEERRRVEAEWQEMERRRREDDEVRRRRDRAGADRIEMERPRQGEDRDRLERQGGAGWETEDRGRANADRHEVERLRQEEDRNRSEDRARWDEELRRAEAERYETERLQREAEDAHLRREEARQPDPEGYSERIVYFGTDRHPAPAPVYYGTDRSELHLGFCVVTVPERRDLGTIPRPSWYWPFEDKDRHYILHSVEEQSEADFVAKLQEAVRQDPGRQALVFVHGFNVTFVDAVYRTAQIAADLEFGGAAAVFSWPSVCDLSKNGYVSDMEQADYAVAHLPSFLNLIADRSGAAMVHVIAHSMGNRLLTNAIRQALVHDAAASKFSELILTAPDIDTDVFVDQIAPAVVRAARRTTLYVSARDSALHLSHRFRPRPRAGDCSEEVVVLPGIDTVDVSDVSTDFVGHSYYGDNKTVLADIFHVMKGHPVAGRFGLRRVKKEDREYWAFRP